jgi:predicted nucleic acid-binding protein
MPNELFLVDTSAWILALRRDFLSVVKDRIGYLLKENAVVTIGLVKLELLGGTKTKSEFQRLKSRLDALDTVECDLSLWHEAADLAFRLRRKGITVPYTDILIAAGALQIGATVMHADAHFDLLHKSAGLKIESFVEDVRRQQDHR